MSNVTLQDSYQKNLKHTLFLRLMKSIKSFLYDTEQIIVVDVRWTDSNL